MAEGCRIPDRLSGSVDDGSARRDDAASAWIEFAAARSHYGGAWLKGGSNRIALTLPSPASGRGEKLCASTGLACSQLWGFETGGGAVLSAAFAQSRQRANSVASFAHASGIDGSVTRAVSFAVSSRSPTRHAKCAKLLMFH